MKNSLTYKEYQNIERELLKIYTYNNDTLLPFDLKILNLEELEKDKFYIGDCRNATVALWDGFKFHYIRSKFGINYLESINHKDYENYEYVDVFQPFAMLLNIDKETKEFFKQNGFEENIKNIEEVE